MKRKKLIPLEAYRLRLLSSMIASGISPVEAFQSFKDKRYIPVMERFESGAPFSEVLKMTTLSKQSMHIDLISSAEQVGAVPEVLKHIAQTFEESKSRLEKLVALLIYPIIVCIISLSLLLLILLFVIPNISPIIKMSEKQVSLVTKILIYSSSSLRSSWYLYLTGATMLFISLVFFFRNHIVKAKLEQVVFKIPKIHTFVINYQCVGYCALLKLHIEYTRNLPLAFKRIAQDIPSRHFSSAFNKISKSIDSGSNLSVSLQSINMLPEIWLIYAVAGERSSAYVEMFNQLHEYYNQAFQDQIQFLMKILEPALMVGIGIVVGILAYGIMSPLYGLMNQFN